LGYTLPSPDPSLPGLLKNVRMKIHKLFCTRLFNKVLGDLKPSMGRRKISTHSDVRNGMRKATSGNPNTEPLVQYEQSHRRTRKPSLFALTTLAQRIPQTIN